MFRDAGLEPFVECCAIALAKAGRPGIFTLMQFIRAHKAEQRGPHE